MSLLEFCESRTISTCLGKISVTEISRDEPRVIILLHGAFLDKYLWSDFLPAMAGYRIFIVDMPNHGSSREADSDWNIEDCGRMLINIIEHFRLSKVTAVGHSLGALAVLHAAVLRPDLFKKAGFADMPLDKAGRFERGLAAMNRLLCLSPERLAMRTAKKLFQPQSLRSNDELYVKFARPFNILNRSERNNTFRNVYYPEKSSYRLLMSLKIPSSAVRGRYDFVPAADCIPTTVVEGGHMSPLEDPGGFTAWLKEDIIQPL